MKLVHKLILVMLSFCPLFSAAADAPEYPSRTVKMIVPFSPGGGVDAIGRIISQQLSTRLKQPFVVENRPGASGNIGVRAAMTTPPDGYTLLLYATAAGMFPLIDSKLGYNPFSDISPVSTVATQPLALFVNNEFPVQSVRDVIRLAKENPGKYAFAGVGVGSPQHMAGELLMYRAGVQLIHVPYKGTAPALADLVAGQTQIGFMGLSSGLPFSKSGKLKVLALASKKRSVLAPEIPTMEEEGQRNFDLGITYFVAVPPGTPAAVIKMLNTEIAAILKDPNVIQALEKQGYEVLASSPEQVLELMHEENRKWAPVVKAAGIKTE